MKHQLGLTLIASLCLSPLCAFAEIPEDNSLDYNKMSGFYLGANAGYSWLNAAGQHSGFAGNPYLGYQFNPYIALESGYLHFADSTDGFQKNSNNYAVYAALKAILPIGQRVSLYSKLGAAMVSSTAHGTIPSYSPGYLTPSFGETSYSDTYYTISPYSAIGTSVALTEHVTLDFQLAGVINSNPALPSVMLAATTGLSYRF